MGLADLAKISARSRVYIGADALDLAALPAELDPGDFAGQSYIEIEDLESLDQLGDRAEMEEHGRSRGGPDLRHYYRKSRTALIWQPRFTSKPWLEGQSSLLAAHAAGVPVAFRIDLGAPVAGVGQQRRAFAGVVGNVTEILGGPTDLPMLRADVWRCSPVLRYIATFED